jgi:glutathione reductase (NADPH)
MKREFDVVVIGSGSAASAVAFPARSAGRTVAMVDSRPFGGTCALRGCDPKKVLVGAAEALDHIARMRGKGITGNPAIAWPELMAFKRTFTETFTEPLIHRLESAGIDAIHGFARFISPSSVQVGGDTLKFKNCLIATGATPAPLSIPGGELAITSDDFLDLEALPERVLFVGGGYIAFEFAHVAARAGASVVIAHRGARPLEKFDPDLVERLVTRTRELGVDVRLGTQVMGIARTGGQFAISVEREAAKEELKADLVVHAAGRVPNIDDLNLEAANVAREKQGISVNEYLQSATNPAVYAAGDAAASGNPPLTPLAGYEGSIVAHNLLHEDKKKTQQPPVPSVVFTVPPLASVGLSEESARNQGRDVEAKFVDTSSWYSSRRIGESCSGAKVLVDRRTDEILGAHLLGPSADETINLFALAMRAGVRASSLKQMLFAYPTHASNSKYLL